MSCLAGGARIDTTPNGTHGCVVESTRGLTQGKALLVEALAVDGIHV